MNGPVQFGVHWEEIIARVSSRRAASRNRFESNRTEGARSVCWLRGARVRCGRHFYTVQRSPAASSCSISIIRDNRYRRDETLDARREEMSFWMSALWCRCLIYSPPPQVELLYSTLLEFSSSRSQDHHTDLCLAHSTSKCSGLQSMSEREIFSEEYEYWKNLLFSAIYRNRTSDASLGSCRRGLWSSAGEAAVTPRRGPKITKLQI